jgi:hypothetical protein
MLSRLYDISLLNSTDWSLIGLFLDMLGAFLIAKIIVRNPHSKEVVMTYLNANPFAIKTSIMSKTDTLIGCMALMLGFLFQGIGTVFNSLAIPKASLLLSGKVGLIWMILIGVLLFFITIRISSLVSLKKYRREHSSDFIEHINEAILTVEAGYLRGDLRKKTPEELKQITNLVASIENAKKGIGERITNVSQLFEINLKDRDDKLNLAVIKRKLEGWIK